MSPFTIIDGYNRIRATTTSVYFGVNPDQIRDFIDCYAVKWGFTSRSFNTRGNELPHELCNGKGYPYGNLNMILYVAVIGILPDQDLLYQLEHDIRNDLQDAQLRLPYHARGDQQYSRNRTRFSESLEYAILRPNSNLLHVVFRSGYNLGNLC
ncbi:hypothetical protein PHMEG_00031638 [Phytophthora megakarya]|uniref:Uncharacterized protein n=1 Tax=Phytophthora megakarya TaxID=4795 RepID=A0A225UYY0_9STRA|nr:hypothetical protein PHMEG_00031638 [Phytophthora megakarya]